MRFSHHSKLEYHVIKLCLHCFIQQLNKMLSTSCHVIKLRAATAVGALVTHVVTPVANLCLLIKDKGILTGEFVWNTKAAVTEFWAAWCRLEKTSFLIIIGALKARTDLPGRGRLYIQALDSCNCRKEKKGGEAQLHHIGFFYASFVFWSRLGATGTTLDYLSAWMLAAPV